MGMRVRDQAPATGLPPCAPSAPSPAERSAVGGLVAMIEGNPVLGGQLVSTEEQERCYRTVADIRRLIDDTRHLLPGDSQGLDLLAAMRGACRKFMSEAEAWDRKAGRRFCMPSFAFYQMLGAYREVMGIYVWRLGETYDLEIEGRLTTIFPGPRD